MEHKFILSCGSTTDLPYSYMQSRGIPVIFYRYTANGTEHIDDMGRDPDALPKFYELLASGCLPSTSQINASQYYDFFKQQLQKGDLLHIAFGSGMSASVFNAVSAAEELRKEFPDRRITVIDSLCSSAGYGLLVDSAADLRDNGASMEEGEQWVLDNRQLVHHQFYSTDLKYYKRSGRMSGAAATVGSILNICPIMHLDDTGHIIAYDKVRGKRNAIKKTVAAMAAHASGGENYSGKCWICHSNCLEDAEATKSAIKERFKNISGDIRICDIGTIIASHCGPGTVAVFFFGDMRQSHDKQ